jgi:hypothetical protein
MLFQEVEDILLEFDGFCRDINFEHPTLEGIETFLTWFCQHYNIMLAYDTEGIDVRSRIIECLQVQNGYIHAVGESSSEVVTRLQVFVSRASDYEPFVELTFFPDELSRMFSIIRLTLTVETWREMLQSDRVYIRPENASWDFPEKPFHSGILFMFGTEPKAIQL